MQIVIFAHFAGSLKHGMVFGHYYLAREWVLAGHKVTIIASAFAHTRAVNPPRLWWVSKENIDGIDYVWLPALPYSAGRQWGRVLNILVFSVGSFVYQFFTRAANLVICSSHHPFPILSARLLAKRSGGKIVFEVRDLWPLTLIELGGVSNKNIFIRIMQWFEDYSYKCSDKVVSVLQGARPYMVSRGMSEDKFVYIPNGIDCRDDAGSAVLSGAVRDVLVDLRDKGSFIVGYAGKVGYSNALHVLVEAVACSGDDKVVAVVLGNGDYVAELKLLADKLGVSHRVLFFSGVPKSEVPDFLGLVDVAYVGLQSRPLFKHGVSPTKLNDYMLAAKPIIFAVDAPAEAILESGAGIVCPPENPGLLRDAILELKGLPPEDLIGYGLAGRDWILNNRNYRVLASRFLAQIFD